MHGADSRHHIPGFSVPDWTWDEKNVYRRWDGAVAVPPDDALTEGHLIVVADGPSGASVEARVAYAAELAAEHSAANVITCRRGLGSDFGPVHVMPRTRDDGLKLHWSKQQGGKIHDKLLPEEPCIFDKIIDGNIPAEVTKRWDNGMAFVPLDPVKDGKHQLVVATEHTRDIGARVGHDGTSGPDIAAMTMRNFVDLTRDMVTSRGVEATQSAPHTHFHAVERDEGDGLELMTSP
ncbi:hypothetical protein [Nocardia neocaledoniensis]|uniref:hypothetical protein n=1 Tax=Nocardia neocaledoniensis TaxID=236511 RepID=UPI0011B720F6|nr:hypothetical protein [Nocardia neocaledoniensis]